MLIIRLLSQWLGSSDAETGTLQRFIAQQNRAISRRPTSPTSFARRFESWRYDRQRFVPGSLSLAPNIARPSAAIVARPVDFQPPAPVARGEIPNEPRAPTPTGGAPIARASWNYCSLERLRACGLTTVERILRRPQAIELRRSIRSGQGDLHLSAVIGLVGPDIRPVAHVGGILQHPGLLRHTRRA
jgi:hypothetical protein